jgi:hypothetical protein
MKSKLLLSGFLALALSALNASAWNVSGVVSCPNGNTAAGIVVFITGVGGTTTDVNGAYVLELTNVPASYTICVDAGSLPAGTTVSGCSGFSVDVNSQFANVDFTLSGAICSLPPPTPVTCWLTGGGTVGKTKGQPDFNFGGVVYPGCSPTAAGGGNWNVIDHLDGLHFKGLNITVIGCSGSSDKAPPVKVNIIDFQGTGTLTGIDGNTTPETAVCFRGHAEDHGEPGRGKDRLYLNVYDCSTGQSLMLISADQANPADIAPVAISTGNLQIHTSGCNK